jgi:TRAP-type C4-dicarboxylate transport system substrate-binding protein
MPVRVKCIRKLLEKDMGFGKWTHYRINTSITGRTNIGEYIVVMKNLLAKLLGGIAVVVCTATGAVAQEVTLKLHHFLPAQANVPKQILDVWADNVERDSGGSIKVDRFPSMQLGGSPTELMDRVINGTDDIVWTVLGYTPGRFPSTEVFEMPFMMKDAGALSCAYWKIFDKHLKDTEFKDVQILGTWVHGPGIFHSEDPIENFSDLEGKKIRGGSRSINSLLELLGATAVGMPISSVPESLSKGVIDGATLPWEVADIIKVPELVENHTEFEGVALYTLTFVLAMNKDKYESLTPDQKAAVDKNSGLEFSIFAGGTQANADGPSREIAYDNGNNIITISGSDVASWQTAVQPVYDNWIADVNSKGLDGQALIDETRQTQDDCLATING